MTQAARIKAARALTEPTPDELEARGASQKWVGITRPELAKRLAAIWPSDAKGGSDSRLRNIESGKGDKFYTSLELPILARALDMPIEFFTLSRSELVARIEAGGAPGVQGETGRELLDGRPSRADQSRPSTPAKAGKKRAGA